MTVSLLLSQAVAGFCIARAADGYSRATIQQYRWGLNKLVESSGNPFLADVNKGHIRILLASLQGRVGAVSVFHVWKAVRAFYKWASVEFGIPRPDMDIHAPPHQYAPVVPFSQDEIKLLLKAVERTKPSEGHKPGFTMSRPAAVRDRAIILTLLDTGIRAGELSRLRVADVDLDTGTLQVRPVGSGIKSRGRVIPMGAITRKALWRYFAERGASEFAFTTQAGRQLTGTALLHLLNNLGARAGVTDVHPHRFRHTFAITLLRNGADIFSLQRLLGHNSLEMVRHYLALAEADDKEAHRRASPVDVWKL